MNEERIAEIVNDLMRRPGHEAVRVNVWGLLTEGLGVKTSEIDHEKREVTGRLDALLGRTIFEFKSNLANEKRDAETQLLGYIRSREAQTGAHYIGVATDGSRFIAYDVAQGELRELKAISPSRERTSDLLVWLSSVISIQSDLDPDPDVIRRELGRESFAYGVARHLLAELWTSAAAVPDIALKRDLWASQLARVYGSPIENDDLFLQHTYLTVVAKTMATLALDIPLPEATALLSGTAFEDHAINGAVEADFFNWVAEVNHGEELVNRIARQVARFRLKDVKTDVLKALYESLIDPEQRHYLGEYYTPDWLASLVCQRAITDPLNQRVLDPSCGSGTFLFHALRQFIDAAERAGYSNRQIVDECVRRVFGIDIHPVAAIIARVTYLLALGPRLTGDPDRGSIAIPVYLGDSFQWNTEMFLAERSVMIGVPGGPDLHFPASVAERPDVFDAVVDQMLTTSDHGGDVDGFKAWAERELSITGSDLTVLGETCAALCQLQRDDRDHIWGYVARNLSRPVWLSSAANRVDVVVGNPPWLSYQFMSADMRSRFKSEAERLGIWEGGRGRVSHQDLCGYALARFSEQYLRPGGTLALVMPYSVMTRSYFASVRTGWYGFGRPAPYAAPGRPAASPGIKRRQIYATLRFDDAWVLDAVKPLFQVPACVLFATKAENGPLPLRVSEWSGTLSKRDASAGEAVTTLSVRSVDWPPIRDEAQSPYAQAFRQGAIVLPRFLFVVERQQATSLGGNASLPVVHSRRTTQEKAPWKAMPPLHGTVEARFVHPLMLGESIGPFRVFDSELAVIPWDDSRSELIDAQSASRDGYSHLARWLSEAQRAWESGGGKGSIVERLDYYKQLSAQFPASVIRVVYSKAGTLPAAAILRNDEAIIDHKLYWARAGSDSEAYYLAAILNSETARARGASKQSRGQWGARDFDKVVFELPIPVFAGGVRLHRELADAASNAERVAGGVALPERGGFIKARQIIREALRQDGIAGRIDALVTELLDG